MATRNQSGRQMVTYASTKSDPICKWRAVSVDNLIELVSWLPKKAMKKESFRDYMFRNHDFDFFHTAYQLACQMALYYESEDGVFYPRFDHDPTRVEAEQYLHKWMERYYVPNPYTKRGFINVPPMHLLYALVQYIEDYPTKPNLATAGAALFGGEMGNITSVKTMLNSFAEILKVDANYDIQILVNRSGKIVVPFKRDDKKAFFEHFN
jgi:hypothetical protein